MKTYRPIEFRHVCAIARALLLQAPTMTDADWKAAVKDACEKQGWTIPDSEQLSRAMGAVERALLETMGFKRGVELPAVRQESAPTTDRCWTAADYRALASTLKQIAARSTTVPPQNVTPIARTVLDLNEPAALDQFYAEAHDGGDRLATLRRFAEIAIVRPAEWDFSAEKAAAQRLGRLPGSACYCCRGDGRFFHRHHVIQLQHGGSNYVRNLVALCDACHADVHPWLPKVARRIKGWSSLADIAPAALAAHMARVRSEAS